MSRRSHRHGERAHARVHRPEGARPASAGGPAASAEVPTPSIPPVAATALPTLAASAALPPVASAALPPAVPASVEPVSVVPTRIALPSEPTASSPEPAAPSMVEVTARAGEPNGHVPEASALEAVAASNGHVARAPETASAPMATAASGPQPPSWRPAVEADRAAADRSEASSDPTRNGAGGGCTAPQLRRFIKSRAYLPMHELRRRFAIEGADDEVAVIDLDGTRVYVGLPEREGRLLGELLRGGDVGFELSHDPATPIIVGVYPMRPVPRN